MSDVSDLSPATQRPARLDVGIVGTGRVGAVLGAALQQAGHRLVAVSGISEQSRVRAAALLPGIPVTSVGEVVRQAELLLLTVPFVWDEHEQPRDFGRYSSFGLTALLGRNGFEVIELRKTMGDVRTIFQMLNAYLFKKTHVRNPYLGLAATLVLMAPFNLAGTILSWVMPRNADLYLDNVVLARKVSGK